MASYTLSEEEINALVPLLRSSTESCSPPDSALLNLLENLAYLQAKNQLSSSESWEASDGGVPSSESQEGNSSLDGQYSSVPTIQEAPQPAQREDLNKGRKRKKSRAKGSSKRQKKDSEVSPGGGEAGQPGGQPGDPLTCPRGGATRMSRWTQVNESVSGGKSAAVMLGRFLSSITSCQNSWVPTNSWTSLLRNSLDFPARSVDNLSSCVTLLPPPLMLRLYFLDIRNNVEAMLDDEEQAPQFNLGKKRTAVVLDDEEDALAGVLGGAVQSHGGRRGNEHEDRDESEIEEERDGGNMSHRGEGGEGSEVEEKSIGEEDEDEEVGSLKGSNQAKSSFVIENGSASKRRKTDVKEVDFIAPGRAPTLSSFKSPIKTLAKAAHEYLRVSVTDKAVAMALIQLPQALKDAWEKADDDLRATVRSYIKQKGEEAVADYGIPGNLKPDDIKARVQWLLADHHYSYGGVDFKAQTYDEEMPISHPGIIGVIRRQWFTGTRCFAIRYPDHLKELPPQTWALAMTSVIQALTSWKEGKLSPSKFSEDNVKESYVSALSWVTHWRHETPTWYEDHLKETLADIWYL
ncbi:hypothetical protein GLOTRDRAFT_92119 [Gloeophyllum trabeum ATCC 11539]|uniref:DUF6532 domain-containing protein n=1 Tax=Gloeophyllum trabeum (strain ATCC 11539 / FP-39264 / Madison 617) TaxID=670483 RepID=S7RUP7_GLOTA|nr:uncharacterized protein GLOTRDRAFT_92119 [Gloeophyllum trabeum ATCC 11539]EPQ56929.1 hypothetical protein GLOTRDRAFT_92119 [Gloeophyllum trabeum ATCC 11539]